MNRDRQLHADRVFSTVRSPTSAAVSPIAASWCRSALHHGLDPEATDRREFVPHSLLTPLREALRPMLDVANPVLDQMFRSVGRSGCGVILSDAQGMILERRAEAGDEADFSRWGLAVGACWGEAEEGTNGIGTCLAEDRPLVIHRDQHFASRNIGISCIDAPIHGPHGNLIAALDVSCCRDDYGPAMVEVIAALVRDAARRIERDYFCRHFEGQRIIFLADDAASGTALLAVDRDGLVVGASLAARLRLRIDDAKLGAHHSLDQLLGADSTLSFDESNRAVLRQALARVGGNASEAARLLGIGRATFYRRMGRSARKS